jgi:hypothetical protein
MADFEEKQYESAANMELSLHHPGVFASGQVLEAVVGYDVAASQPQNAPIWQLIGANAPPGLRLVPNHWNGQRRRPRAADLPSTYVSLVLQYKRPRYLNTPRATQWHHWNNPYFRFEVSNYAPTYQHDTLIDLEPALAPRAVVQYACPAFFTYADLQAHQLGRTVLPSTNFVAPSGIGAHAAWTYTNAGTVGYANPTGETIRGISFKKLWGLVEKAGHKENLLQHRRGLAEGLEPEPEAVVQEWLAHFPVDDLSPARIQGLRDVVALGSMFGQIGASWSVVDLEMA